jgi:hypothetical protein
MKDVASPVAWRFLLPKPVCGSLLGTICLPIYAAVVFNSPIEHHRRPVFVSEANTGAYIYDNENEETNPSTALANIPGVARVLGRAVPVKKNREALSHRTVCIEWRSV